MFNLTKTSVASGIISLAAIGGANPAMAGQCSAAGTNALANAPTMPKNVTDTVIGAVDLGSEINVDGRQLRTRRLVVQPGGIVPLHSHADRPALIITVNVWDDAKKQLLVKGGKRITVMEGVSGETFIGSGWTQTKEQQMKKLADNAAKAVQDYMLEHPEWLGLPVPPPKKPEEPSK